MKTTCIIALALTCSFEAQAQYTYTTFSVPGASATRAQGISGNYIVGLYEYGNGPYNAFLYNIGSQTFSTINEPGASLSVATGISGNNIVGYTTAGGFLCDMNSQTYVNFTVPGASQTILMGI